MITKYIDLKEQPLDLSGATVWFNEDLTLGCTGPNGRLAQIAVKAEQFGGYLAVEVPDQFENAQIGIMANPGRFMTGAKANVYIHALFIIGE